MKTARASVKVSTYFESRHSEFPILTVAETHETVAMEEKLLTPPEKIHPEFTLHLEENKT